MTITTRTQEHDLTPLYRVQIKANNIPVWLIHSESGYTYKVAIFNGKASGCSQVDGTDCPSWKYRHTCHHAVLAQQLEARYLQEQATVPLAA
jgi:hypothetical protein